MLPLHVKPGMPRIVDTCCWVCPFRPCPYSLRKAYDIGYLDIIDHSEPTMLIVGSRGLGQLKGSVRRDYEQIYSPNMFIPSILLGSTSHYLVQVKGFAFSTCPHANALCCQKCSVPVMVARRRLKRPAKRSAHLATHRARVSLAEAAGVERITPKVDQQVEQMRDQLEREDERREHDRDEDEDMDTEVEGDVAVGRKVRGD